ncbi:MAG: hypothetical protein QM734_08980 [Cyclobacteriaceae bacterium]
MIKKGIKRTVPSFLVAIFLVTIVADCFNILNEVESEEFLYQQQTSGLQGFFNSLISEDDKDNDGDDDDGDEFHHYKNDYTGASILYEICAPFKDAKYLHHYSLTHSFFTERIFLLFRKLII